MSTILITGGTGLIGKSLTQMLITEGHKVIVLSRSAKAADDSNISYAIWDVKKQTIDTKAVAVADYIIHLAGAGVADERWSKGRKQEIVDSRVQSSSLLVKALQNTENHVRAVISASATGWYGEDNVKNGSTKPFSEEAPADKDFLGETCRLWEQSIEPVTSLGIRLVRLRTGIVLANEGGAFAEFKKPVKFGIAAVLGSGLQTISWIHIEDLCRMYLFAMDHQEISGVYNAVAPMPVKNKQLMLLLAKRLKGKFSVAVHVPAFLLKIIMGEMSVEVLKSATVSANKIRAADFTFLYPSIEAAVDKLLQHD